MACQALEKINNDEESGWVIALELYESYTSLIKSTIKNPKKVKVEKGVWDSTMEREGWEDMLAEGRVQFYEALLQFDPDDGTYFPHYIKSKLNYGIFNYLRNGQVFDKTIKETDSFEEKFEEDRDQWQGRMQKSLYTEVLKNNNNIETDIDYSFMEEEYQPTSKELLVKVAWNSLNERQKKVLELTINREYTLREAGNELDVHFTTIRETKNNALKKMKKVIKKY